MSNIADASMVDLVYKYLCHIKLAIKRSGANPSYLSSNMFDYQ